MNPVYIDLHIHTSENPNAIESAYNLDSLIENISKIAKSSHFLISFTDHNTINKALYLQAVDRKLSLILGVELHIEYDSSKEPYHCHMYFDINEITGEVIDLINNKLDKLYPNKVISCGDGNIPHLDMIVNELDEFEFLLLPHGGQSHRTFDTAIPEGARFDTTIERSIYYNQFDGFTARSNQGLEQTQSYFIRLGINDFVNLITCTDNYVPEVYPRAKAKDASPFIPTWMYAEPSFAGLRLSLSESSRLVYGDKPQMWSEFIQKISLHNESIDIEANLSPGLNVVIGGSSSGKTLFVDSIYNKIRDSFDGSNYLKYGIEGIYVQNPSGVLPHYISQNYIVQLVNQTEGKTIDEIDMIRNIFPGDEDIIEHVNASLARFKIDLESLISAVKRFENACTELKRIPVFTRLLLKKEKTSNVFGSFLPDQIQIDGMVYPDHLHEKHLENLSEIEEFIKLNSFAEYDEALFKKLRAQLDRAFDASGFESTIRKVVTLYKDGVDAALSAEDSEQQGKSANYEKLLTHVSDFSRALDDFQNTLLKLTKYSINCKTQEIQSMGHSLFIENRFQISQEALKDVLNKFLKTEHKIKSIGIMTPYDLFETNFSKKSPKVHDYSDFVSKVFAEFEGMNKIIYRITTNSGKDFQELSAGWKTSVLLDLILGYEGDSAPLIIDQPEDNLATSYINHGLIKAIKSIKSKKQIILVSHNATIPMLGDAQTVVVCTNNKQKISIVSNPLEGKLNERSIVDHIAEITDGGKSSIKKRVKKYNLKSFRG